MRILAATRGDAASYYRLQAPFGVLRYRGLDVEIRPASVADAGNYDVLWLQMHADPMTELLVRDFQAAGGKVVYDVDDWVFDMPPSWPSFGQYFQRGSGEPRDLLRFHERLIQMSDLVTASAPRLAENLRMRFPDQFVQTLPNCVMAGDWDIILPKSHDRSGPVLGWFGTGNHWDDWTEIVDAVDGALARVDGHLALMGAPEMMACFPDRLRKRTVWHPLVSMADFQQVRELAKACDVGLAWATDRLETSRCRSPLKAMQWGAAGVPLVASETVYRYRADGHYIAVPQDNLQLALEQTLTDAYLGNGVLTAAANRWQQEVFSKHCYELCADWWKDTAESVLPEPLDEI